MPRGGIVVRFSFVELGFHLLVAQTERRTAAGVEPVEFVFLRAVNDREKIAADAVRNRLHQTEGGVRGDRGIDRAAAALQNIETDLRGRGNARANHSVTGQHFGARGEGAPGDAIDLGVGEAIVSAREQSREKEATSDA